MYQLLLFLLVGFTASSAQAGDQTKTRFTVYSGNRKCDPGSGGGNQAFGSGRPLDHTWENPGGGWVMVAVCPSKYRSMHGCTGKVRDRTVKVEDICPGCCGGGGLAHMDMSHTCTGNNMLVTVEWDDSCKGVNAKGQHPKIRVANRGPNDTLADAMEGAEELACDTPEQVSEKIQTCSDNHFARESAEACRDRTVAALEAHPGNKDVLDLAARNLHRIAEYPPVMMDGAHVGLGSVPCYTGAASGVAGAVTELDRKITHAKNQSDENP